MHRTRGSGRALLLVAAGVLVGLSIAALGLAVLRRLSPAELPSSGEGPRGIAPPATARAAAAAGTLQPDPALPAARHVPEMAPSDAARPTIGWYRRGETPAAPPADRRITPAELDDYLWTWEHDPVGLHRGTVLTSLMAVAPADPRVVDIYRGLLAQAPGAPNRQVAFMGLTRARMAGVREPWLPAALVDAIIHDPAPDRREWFVDMVMHITPHPSYADMDEAYLDVFWRGPVDVRLHLANAIAEGGHWDTVIEHWPGVRERVLGLLGTARTRESDPLVQRALDAAASRHRAPAPSPADGDKR